MTGIVIIRPGLYSLHIGESGVVQVDGLQVNPVPCVSCDIVPKGVPFVLADMILLGAGKYPLGLTIGVPR